MDLQFAELASLSSCELLVSTRMVKKRFEIGVDPNFEIHWTPDPSGHTRRVWGPD